MIEQYNPFKENRTEQMRELWKYYVPFSGLGGDAKPLVVEGGRGSGKTMFFQCNSWRQMLLQLKKNEEPITDIFQKKEFVGIYYRVDTTFVSSMKEREEENWNAIFETYLSISILKEILDFVCLLNENMKLNESSLLEFSKTYSKKIYPDSNVESIYSFRKECDFYLDLIEDKINGGDVHEKLRYVNAHRYVMDICQEVGRIIDKEDILFKIFIDEYETLQEYQQKIVNTLIKHSTLPVVFNIGLRPKGMKTPETISDTETIESPHDYELLPLGYNEEQYFEMIKTICKKRILLGKEQGKIPAEASDDIEDYLGNYSLEYELNKIEKSKFKLPHVEKLKRIIEEQGVEQELTKEQIDDCCKALCDDAPILNSRVHYALLCKKTKYTPTIKELYESYITNNSRYSDWMHNRKNGAVFLLCKEAKKEKMYYGFDTYLTLSSNIVRYFLELCEHAFKIAFLNGYTWNGEISPETQTEAAQYVSDYKVVDISGYEPYGKELRIFTQYLGQIFYKLHTAEDNTLGEPEPNHFNTKDLSLSDKSKKLIASAIMWNVLQEGEATKKKNSKLSPETVDYYLNKIYVPYFGISYRNQRKISISVEILDKLFSGSEEVAKRGMTSFFRTTEGSQASSSSEDSQITLFDSISGGDL